MPVFKNSMVVELARGVKAFLNYEVGLTRGAVPPPVGTPGSREEDPELARLRRALAEAKDRIAELKERAARPRLAPSIADTDPDSAVDPATMVWVFGTGRTGSTWLSQMMGDLPAGHFWNEPLFGKLFGDLYYSQREDRQRQPSFVLGDPPEARRVTIRSFVLGATALRYPEFVEGGGYLVIKEPGGSIGAPLLMDALPESRMIFLVRDFRDSVASYMDGVKPGGRIYRKRDERGKAAFENEPEQISALRRRVKLVAEEVRRAKEAYDAHSGPKVLVKYEDLRADTLGTMKRIYSTLDIPVDEVELTRVVDKHSWENVPEHMKGPGKHRRKAAPGTWKDDLTPQQARIVESALTPLVKEFYPS